MDIAITNLPSGTTVTVTVTLAMTTPPTSMPTPTLDVVLTKVPEPTKKIPVIKVVREITGLGLKEAKDIVDNAPQTVKNGVPREEAEAMKAKLEKEGATVALN